MAKIQKDTEVSLDILVKAVNDTDEQLESLKGETDKIATISKTVEDITSRFDDALRRATNGGKSSGARFPGLTPEMKKAMTFDILHKMPTETAVMVEKKRSGEVESKSRVIQVNEDDVLGQFQKNADDLYIFGAYKGLLDGDSGRLKDAIKSTHYYQETYAPRQRAIAEILRKEAFDSADAGAGLEYVPTDHSSRLFDLVELEPGLADYFETIPMTRGKQDFPSWLDNFVLAIMGERTADGYDAGTTGRAADMLGTKSVTGLVSFEAVKFGGIIFWSKEVEEDSILPLLPLLSRKIVRGAKRTQDISMIHGQKTATIDTDVAAAAATVAEKAYDGLRYDALAGLANVNAEGNKINTNANWNEYVHDAKGLMGVYGVNKSRLIRLWSGVGENQISAVDKFAIVSAFGNQASVLGADATTGVRREGVEDVISEFMRDDLAVSGKNEGSGNDYTSALIVHRDAWATGVRREIRLEMSKERWFELDLDAIKVTMRRHFKRVLTVGTPTAVIRNIGK